jgi:hypothetical protein
MLNRYGLAAHARTIQKVGSSQLLRKHAMTKKLLNTKILMYIGFFSM